MLSYISIKNFALIEQLDLQLESGFNVLTGETGAGKSIIIDAVGLIVGERASQDFIRTGADSAVIEAVFHLEEVHHDLEALFEEYGIVLDEDQTLIIQREIQRNGKGTIRINGRLSNLSILRDLGSFIIDIHGQNEHQSVMHSEKHIHILDNYIGEELKSRIQEYRGLFHELAENRKQQKTLGGDVKERNRTIELLQYQLQEIQSAQLNNGEDETLLRQNHIIASREKLLSSIETAKMSLYEQEGTLSAYDLAGKALDALSQAGAIDPDCVPLRERTETILFLIDDLMRDLRSYSDTIDFDEDSAVEIQNRLDLIYQLKRKYGSSISEILDYAVTIENQLQQLIHSESILLELKRSESKLMKQLSASASEMSSIRTKGADKLSHVIMAELSELGMKRVEFMVTSRRVHDPEGLSMNGESVKFHANGVDYVEFLISTNPGEPLKPLIKIASGGEVSRIMLAVKSVLASTEMIPTLIFDEIDAGIGGRAAQSVARRLREIANNCQVLCVTHLPQIAASAQVHFYIQKESRQNRTETTVCRLASDERILEIARMLSGDQQTETAMNHAREMIENS